MPSLNDDVLNAIFHEIFRKSFSIAWIGRKKNTQTLEKFMLAGREPYEIALRNFTHASSIEILQYELVITVDLKVRLFKASVYYSSF